MSERNRNPALDGLRGVAVCLVLLYHHNLVHAGWVGVDLFFVLSGFLITGILRKTRDDRGYWKEFWIKRVTRILPPLLLLLMAAVALGVLPWRWAPWYLLSFGDVVAVLKPGFVTTGPLWSLGVEEHFYFLWPFAVRWLKRRQLVWLLVALILGEPVLRFFFALLMHPLWETIYYLTPFRLEGLGMGCLLALLLEDAREEVLVRRWSGPGLGVVVVAYLGLWFGLGLQFTRGGNSPTYNALCYWLVALGAVCLVAYPALERQSLLARVLSWGPLVQIGRISYGIYLYQLLIQRWLGGLTRIPLPLIVVVVAPVTIAVAWVSFYAVEQPLILWGKRRAERYRASLPEGRLPASVYSAP